MMSPPYKPLCWASVALFLPAIRSFTPPQSNRYKPAYKTPLTTSHNDNHVISQHFSSQLFMASNNPIQDGPFGSRRGIKVPLLDVPDPEPGSKEAPENQPLVVIPLPSDHLPAELRDLNVYGMELTRPVHKLIMEDAIGRIQSQQQQYTDKPVYGHLAWKPDGSSLVGAIGCISEILLQADGNSMAALMGGGIDTLGGTLETAAQASSDESLPKTIVSCGAFRFIVKEVLQTVPFPIAIVDELIDNDSDADTTHSSLPNLDDEGDDDDDYEDYANMSPTEIIQDLFQTLQSFVDEKVEEASNQQISPLEQAILEDTGLPADPVAAEQTRAEQVAATWITFQGSLLDVAPSPKERYYAIAMMAAEIVDLKNSIRRKMHTMTNGIERLRLVHREVKDAAGMARAAKMAQQITAKTDESDKDLKVGTPELPPWARQIRKGMKVAYYWNEEWEWCEAEVVDDPVLVVDELLVTVRFEDGEVHRLPFDPNEKARWRPA